jgi:CheY-like chemotaxis protein
MRCVVLVVEDEPLVRMGAVAIAQEAADKVYEAANADEAIEVLERNPDVTLLFTDIDMPGTVDGLELAEIVHERWPHIRLIVTSGRVKLPNDEVPDDGRFIGKPYYAETIRSAIAQEHQQLGP